MVPPLAPGAEAKGLRARDDEGAYWKWVPVIGTKAIAEVTRRDLEEVVQALDRAVLAGLIAWKRATNIWGVATKMMADACKSKMLGLRVREDNPARDVEGPDRGVEKDRRPTSSRASFWPSCAASACPSDGSASSCS